MWRRGADPDGYVANFVETEQIVQMNGYSSSFVQVFFLHACLAYCEFTYAANRWSFYRYIIHMCCFSFSIQLFSRQNYPRLNL